MPNIKDQTIVLTLEDEVTGPYITPQKFVPDHTHSVSDLLDLNQDLFPQYLTVARAITLIKQVLSGYGADYGFITGAENVGDGIGIYKQNDDGTLQFYTLEAGEGISITQSGNKVTFNVTAVPVTELFDILTFVGTIASASGSLSYSGSIIEWGAVINTISFSATTNNGPDSATFTLPPIAGGGNYDLTDTPYFVTLATSMQWNFTSPYPTATLNIGDEIEFILTATENEVVDTANKTFTVGARVYYGFSADSGATPESPTDNLGGDFAAFISGLVNDAGSTSKILSDRQTTFTADNPADTPEQKSVFYIYPAEPADGIFEEITTPFSQFYLQGSAGGGGFFRVLSGVGDNTFTLTNQFGQSISYYVYQSDNAYGAGAVTIVVS